jgi:hypothetical protein
MRDSHLYRRIKLHLWICVCEFSKHNVYHIRPEMAHLWNQMCIALLLLMQKSYGQMSTTISEYNVDNVHLISHYTN